MQGRLFELVTERLENKKALCMVRAPLCACAFISDLCYAKEVQGCNQYEKGLLMTSRFSNLDFQQKEIPTENPLVDSSTVVLVATKMIIVSEKRFASSWITELARSVQLEYI